MAVAETEACLIGINKAQLAIMQKNLLEAGNDKDYFVIESILKGNFLIKDQWRKEFNDSQLGQHISNSHSQREEDRESLMTKSNISNMNVNVQYPRQHQ